MTPAVVLSPALWSDEAFFLLLRNDPAVRAQSFEGHEIGEEEHRLWFEASFGNPLRRLFVATEAGKCVGTARLDKADFLAASVSVAVLPSEQGRGIGAAILKALAIEAGLLGLRRLVAEIKESNTASRVAFSRTGFLIEENQDGIVTMYRELGDKVIFDRPQTLDLP